MGTYGQIRYEYDRIWPINGPYPDIFDLTAHQGSRTAGGVITAPWRASSLHGSVDDTLALGYVPLEKVPKGTGRGPIGPSTYHWKRAAALLQTSTLLLGC